MFISGNKADSVMLDSIVNFLVDSLPTGHKVLYLYCTWFISFKCAHFFSVIYVKIIHISHLFTVYR